MTSTKIKKTLLHRQLGNITPLSFKNGIQSNLFSSIMSVRSWDPVDISPGGIFNFDFSPDGSLLASACERKCFLLFDPLNGQLIKYRSNAHSDCVNCVRFLDSRTFVTCSDDTTVSLWDVRYIKHKIRTLRGHSNWVKNIEYSSDLGLLVTSGFDGSIYTWDINRYSESGLNFSRVFHTNGLMRTKLTPDGTKLIISTAGGYLMVVHDLDLTTLADDLQGFKPNMYRLMQMSHSPIRQAWSYNHVFNRKKNRVEFISDFPAPDEAETIASLEVHPHGWCVLSRNTSNDENSEWTCVHDIQGTQDEVEEMREVKPGDFRYDFGQPVEQDDLRLAVTTWQVPQSLSESPSPSTADSNSPHPIRHSNVTGPSTDLVHPCERDNVRVAVTTWQVPQLNNESPSTSRVNSPSLSHQSNLGGSSTETVASSLIGSLNSMQPIVSSGSDRTALSNDPDLSSHSNSVHSSFSSSTVSLTDILGESVVQTTEEQSNITNISTPVPSVNLDNAPQHTMASSSHGDIADNLVLLHHSYPQRPLESSSPLLLENSSVASVSPQSVGSGSSRESTPTSSHQSCASLEALSSHDYEEPPPSGYNQSEGSLDDASSAEFVEQTASTSFHSSASWDAVSSAASLPAFQASRRGSLEQEVMSLSRAVDTPSANLILSSAADGSESSEIRLSDSVTCLIRPSSHAQDSRSLLSNRIIPSKDLIPVIYQNKPRLTHYIEEPNLGRGFIKEICFSNDGRLVCSPFGYGVRLLAFDSSCRELCDCVPRLPLQLHEVTSNMSHSSVVVTAKFSPTHCLLVTGSLSGKVDFHQPVL